MDDVIAKELNRYCDRAFLDSLSECECTAMSELVEEFFCSSTDEEEQGEQSCIKTNFRILLVCATNRAEDKTEDSLTTDDHYVLEQLIDPVQCYMEDHHRHWVQPRIDDGEKMLNVIFQRNETTTFHYVSSYRRYYHWKYCWTCSATTLTKPRWGKMWVSVAYTCRTVDLEEENKVQKIPHWWLWLQASQKWALLFTIHTRPLHSNEQ